VSVTSLEIKNDTDDDDDDDDDEKEDDLNDSSYIFFHTSAGCHNKPRNWRLISKRCRTLHKVHVATRS